MMNSQAEVHQELTGRGSTMIGHSYNLDAGMKRENVFLSQFAPDNTVENQFERGPTFVKQINPLYRT
jgi:hypothetical protein